MLEQTDSRGNHIPRSVRFCTWNKASQRPGKVRHWPQAHATGHRHKHGDTSETISIYNTQTSETRTVNTWGIFELNGQPVVL